MKKMSKTLSVLLAVLMVFAAIPMTASAESDTEVVIDTVYTAEISTDENVVTFTPTESGEYALISDNSKNYEVDPSVMVYDSDNNLVTQGDDEGGEFNFYCFLNAEADETYYIHLNAYQKDVAFDYVIKKHVEITHQPTADEPYVELNWDIDAEYQWYSVGSEYGEVTDENAIGRYAHDVGPATYDEENGWTGAAYDEFEAVFFRIEMIAGQQIEFVTDEAVGSIGIWYFDGRIHTLDVRDAGEPVYFTAEVDDTYYVFTEGNVNAHIKAYTDNIIYTPVEGATDSEFTATRSGKYRCFVTLEDGTVIKSDTFDVNIVEEIELDTVYTAELPKDGYVIASFTPTESGKYAVVSDNGGRDSVDPYVEIYDSEDKYIADDDDSGKGLNFYCVIDAEAGETYYICLYEYDAFEVEYDYYVKKHIEIEHQPTVDEPYVELNWELNATYQWYYGVASRNEVTDENAEGRYADENGPATYDSENGWSSVPYNNDEDEANYFAIEMVAGQEIEMIPDADVELLGIWSETGNWQDFENVTAGKSVYFTADTDDVYYVYTLGNSDAHIRAYTKTVNYRTLHGATDSELDTIESGMYRCKVTLENGDTIFSETFTKCEHSCHQGGITGFFWRITLFFYKIFGLNKVCECGDIHY